MKSYRQKVVEAAGFLKSGVSGDPKIAILTGTGLGETADIIEVEKKIKYRDIPHFPLSTVRSHDGNFLSGEISGRNTIAFQGRFHLYEGYSPREVIFPVRVMKEMGAEYLILSNAAGGLDPDFVPGDIMIISDHINLTGSNPLTGPNESAWGVRFPDMIRAYDKGLSKLAESIGEEAGISLKKGVYAGLKGPSLETPAEVKFLRMIGADSVGFSTVLEVIGAVHSGIKVLGLSTITNINDPEAPLPATMEEVIAVARKAAPGLSRIIGKTVEGIGGE